MIIWVRGNLFLSQEEMGSNLEWNDLREILTVFESLGGVFSETSEYQCSTGGQTSKFKMASKMAEARHQLSNVVIFCLISSCNATFPMFLYMRSPVKMLFSNYVMYLA